MRPAGNPVSPAKPFALWLTGLPAAGKTTLAGEIAGRLRGLGYAVRVLDGDDLRDGLNADLGFSDADREENVRRFAEVARLFLDSGLLVLASVISPFRAGRERARTIVGADRFLEVFVDAPPEVCQRRDPKGLYAKARAGRLAGLTGFDAPYEAPENPSIHLRTDRDTPEALAGSVIRYLKEEKRL